MIADVIQMAYTDEQIVEILKRRKRNSSSARTGVSIMGAVVLGLVVCTIWMINDASKKTGGSLLSNEPFLAGLVCGFAFVGFAILASLAFVRTFSMFHGYESQAYDLLLRLWRERKGEDNKRPAGNAEQ